MTKKIYLSVCLLFCTSFLIAQTMLSGKVIDVKTGKHIVGAKVVVTQNGIHQNQTTTDRDGNFSWHLSPGTYDVRVNHQGYQESIITDVVVILYKENKLFIQLGETIPQPGVYGTLLDETGEVLIGGNILIQSTSLGTISDIDGSFQLAAEVGDTLLINYIGYETKAIEVKTKNMGTVTLLPSADLLDEVVITALSSSSRKLRSHSNMNRIAIRKRRDQNNVSADRVKRDRAELNSESYASVSENDFKDVSENPLSTFSVDVDAASYSNIRRYLAGGSLPPKEAVRIEEMINYFNYDYPQPIDDTPFSIHSELGQCPWNNENLLLHVGLQGKEIPLASLPPSNIVFLLDVSGSMNSPNKLPLLKSSLKLLLKQLRKEDRVAIVVYAGSSGLVLKSTPGNNEQKIVEALDKLRSGGSTAGKAGLELAYKVAVDNFIKGGNNRIVLATDGDFNVGASSDEAMKKLIEGNRDKGVFISVLGFGMGNMKDSKMEAIADNGNGNYAYIDNIEEAKKVLVKEFGGTMHTIAKDVKFQLEFNPAEVAEYRLIGYANRLLEDKDFEDDKKDAGDIGAGHNVTALYEIILAKKSKKKKRLKYQESVLTPAAELSNDLITLKLRYKKPDSDKSKLVEKVIKNESIAIQQTTNNFNFAVAVAEFGMLLTDSKYKGNATWKSAIDFANYSKGSDDNGYRAEMISLMKTAEGIK